jgi:hypothetical protein
MKYVYIFSLFCFISHGNLKKTGAILKPVISRSINEIDTSKYAILKFDKNQYKNYDFSKHVVPSTLSEIEIQDIEDIISKEVIKYNQKEKEDALSVTKKRRKMLNDPSYVYRGGLVTLPFNYYKQFIPVLNRKQQKEVFVSCFCEVENNLRWKEFLVLPDGGGSCYFSLKINLTKRSTAYFYVNAPL